MSVGTEIAHLRRAVDAFVAGVSADLAGTAGLSQPDRTRLRAEIETCSQLLDELRARLSAP